MIEFIDSPAIIREVVYQRQNREANSLACDEHERLIKEGWECLGNSISSTESWTATYVKRN